MRDGREMVGTLLAYDLNMNLIIADTQVFRTIKDKKPKRSGKKKAVPQDERQDKRTLGLVVLAGNAVSSLTAECPPPMPPAKQDNATGKGLIATRSAPAATAIGSAPAGLAGPVRGVGGPADIQMQPKAAAPMGGSFGMPAGLPVRPPGMPNLQP